MGDVADTYIVKVACLTCDATGLSKTITMSDLSKANSQVKDHYKTTKSHK